MKIALFGGTFNPIHHAHLFIASEMADIFSLDKVIFIPANIPPHKNYTPQVSNSDRLKMIQLAIQSNPGFSVSDIEIQRGGLSYTIDTVKTLYQEYEPKGRLFVIIGGDLIPELHTWYQFEELCTLVDFLVYNRENENGKDISVYRKNIFPVEGMQLGISSTIIRDRFKNGKNVRYLIPDTVREYIRDNKLYL